MIEIIIGGLLAWVAQLAKARKIDQKYIITSVSFILWAARYYLWPHYQDLLIETWLMIAGSATLIYNFIVIYFENTKDNG